MTTAQKVVVIDGCALPLDLYNQARHQAIATHVTQCIGVIYDAPPQPRPAAPATMLELAAAILSPSPFFADLRAGNHLRYLMGCTRDELSGCGCAMILYITWYAEEAGE